MPSELAPVVKVMALNRLGDASDHVGRVGGVEVVATRTGMGQALATAVANRLLDAETVDHVIVVGIAGGIGTSTVGALVCPSEVVDGATGRRYAATPLTDLANGVISSSDEFIVDPERVGALVASGVRAVDMETAAIAAVCAERGVAWSAVRVVSDLATDHPDAAMLGLAHPDGSPNLPAAFRFMLTHPRRVPQMLRIGRDSMSAARGAAAEAARQIRALPGGH